MVIIKNTKQEIEAIKEFNKTFSVHVDFMAEAQVLTDPETGGLEYQNLFPFGDVQRMTVDLNSDSFYFHEMDFPHADIGDIVRSFALRWDALGRPVDDHEELDKVFDDAFEIVNEKGEEIVCED